MLPLAFYFWFVLTENLTAAGGGTEGSENTSIQNGLEMSSIAVRNNQPAVCQGYRQSKTEQRALLLVAFRIKIQGFYLIYLIALTYL